MIVNGNEVLADFDVFRRRGRQCAPVAVRQSPATVVSRASQLTPTRRYQIVRGMNRSLLTLALALAGCVAETSTFPSSRSLLARTLSGAATAHGVDETGRELVRLFEIRDYAVADAYRDPATGERLLKLAKIDRASAADRAAAWPPELASIGSVFYVWIAPAPDGSTIHLLGKPTLTGEEPCTQDGLDLPCAPLRLRADLVAAHLNGRAEAAVAQGVLSELALEGYTAPARSTSLPPTAGRGVAASDGSDVEAALDAHDAQIARDAVKARDAAIAGDAARAAERAPESAPNLQRDQAGAAERDRCRDRRAALVRQIAREPDPKRRLALVHQLPTC